MRKFGLIGYPIAHSQSPRLFAEAYGGAYPYDLIEDPSFDRCWERFLAEYEGVNVTAPFKTLALERADIASPACERIGAANIVVKSPEGIRAYNSDYLAVRAILEREDVRGRALVIGAGGAGRAAAVAATDHGLGVIVANRTLLPGCIGLHQVKMLAPLMDIVINCLPVGSQHLVGLECPLMLEPNYAAPVFRDAPGVERYIGGEVWLRDQARLGYRLLTGESPR